MKKNRLKKVGMTILALFLLFTVDISTATAAVVPDLSKEGSITVAMRNPETNGVISGGNMTLFKVGDVYSENGNFSFVLTADFSGSGQSLSRIEGAEAAKNLAAYAKKQNVKGTTVTIGSDGNAVFSAVKPGLYLLTQKQAAKGYYNVTPFLVSVPLLENESYLYDIDATPKMEPLKKQPDSSKPDITPDPKPNSTPATSNSKGGTPKTGDTTRLGLWLILLCGSAAGIVFLLLLGKRSKSKKTER